MAKKAGGGCVGGCAKLFVLVLVAFGLLLAIGTLTTRGKPAPIRQAAPQAASTPSAPVIPGLQHVDIYVNLEKQGFKRTGPHQVEGTYFNNCDLDQDGVRFHAESHGPDLKRVASVTATVAQGVSDESETGEIAKDFLGMIGSLPFDGADPAANKAWVQSNINGGSEVRQGVLFTVTANPAAPRVRRLDISLPK